MTNLRRPAALLGLAICSILLTSCLGSDPKSLGSKSSANTSSSANTDADTFSITTAYRAPATRLVLVQGVRSNLSGAMVNTCGTTGTSCTCDFFTSSSNTAAATADPTVGISKENNSFSCSIPTSIADPNTIARVRLRTVDNKKTTGFINIKTTLTLQEVIGDLNVAKVNKIYRYSCQRTFFEGEGVSSQCSGGSTSCINCLPAVAQKLGVIMATYEYYLFENKEGVGNRSKKFVSSFWPGICARPDAEFARAQCATSTPTVRYGLYGTRSSPFTISVTMTSAPEGSEKEQVYGFAATPDSAGNCPTGLIKVRPYVAQPPSITAGSLDGINPSSNFLNLGDGLLNNIVIETTKPADFNVLRQPNQTPCALATGSCAAATFGGISTATTTAYSELSPVICVIPDTLLTGL